ncbi:MAG: ATP-binding protein [Gammaproteobacteria bacterium]|nr:ATP-binding protein [Gammaproteobacteria bacterium]
MQNLPLATSTLATLRDNDMIYIDKTPLIAAMTRLPGRYFLSRPRRFGKSTLVDTFKELFEGNQRLFAGLFIHDKWDWSRRFPVIKIDFADGVIASRAELDRHISTLLYDNQQRLGVVCDEFHDYIPGCFADLIRKAKAQYGKKVVILIDEYDKPILDNIEHPDRAAEVREGLKNLYSVMKGQDAHIQFIFMTGVTKFSKVSLFSGLNQLQDITLDSHYATICGYTQNDLESSFAEHLAGVDWEKLKQWYNGYNFLGEQVYNPYDILLFIANQHGYRNYWFETGTPAFLVKLFRQQNYFLPELEQIQVGEELLNSFEIERINPITLLFQSGYLTISRVSEQLARHVYHLAIPNQEVQQALYDHFIDGYTDQAAHRLQLQTGLYDALIKADLSQLFITIRRLFAGVPWRNFTNNDLADDEGYYASVLYAFFSSLNATIIPEDISNRGQVDLTVQLAGYTYLIEIKVNHTKRPAKQGKPNAALKQILVKNYAEKYRGSGKGVFAVGLVFNSQLRQLVQADYQLKDE